MRFKYLIVIIIIIQSCQSKDINFDNFEFVVENSIKFSNDQYSLNNFDFRGINDSLIYAYDIMKAVVFKFDSKGNLIKQNRFQNSENEINLQFIGDIFPINKDSILILDNGYGNLLLLNSDLKLINSWHISKLTKENLYVGGNRSQIVNFENVNKEPEITIVAGDGNYFMSEKIYFDNSFLAIKVNLNSGTFKPLFKYPYESPYRNNLFWSDESPYFIFDEGNYYVSFPFDPNVYVFTEDSDSYEIINYTGSLKKHGTGVEFGMNQSEFLASHMIYVQYVNNDYNLISKSLYKNSQKKYFVRVVRKAINSDVGIKDINTFAIESPKQDFIIQIVDLDQKEPFLWREYKLPEFYRNFTFTDKNGKFYFNKRNDISEEYNIDIIDWSFND